MAEHVAVYCQRPLAWDWQDRVCGLSNYVKETVERVEPCRLSYGSFWRKAVGRINDLIGSSELVYSKVIRPPIGTLDADQGTQSAL